MELLPRKAGAWSMRRSRRRLQTSGGDRLPSTFAAFRTLKRFGLSAASLNGVSKLVLARAAAVAGIPPLELLTSGNRWSMQVLKSETGHWRRFDSAPATSDLPRLADILRIIPHVSKVPTPDVAIHIAR